MNEPKHVLAILRRVTGLTQKEFGALVGRSLATIQGIEYNEMPLSEGLGNVVSAKTGVSLEWLMKDDSAAPIVAKDGRPYTHETFERAASKDCPINPDEMIVCALMFTTYTANIAKTLLAALNGGEGDVSLMAYRFSNAIRKAGEPFRSYAKRVRAKKICEWDESLPEWVSKWFAGTPAHLSRQEAAELILEDHTDMLAEFYGELTRIVMDRMRSTTSVKSQTKPRRRPR